MSLVADLDHRGQAGRVAHLQVELGKSDFTICALPGCVTMRYPKGWVVALNRTELEPWWGAGQPAIMGLTFLLTVLVLVVTW